MSTAVSRQKKSAPNGGNRQSAVRCGTARQGRNIHRKKHTLILSVTRSICQGFPFIFWFGSPWFILGSVGAHENGAIGDGQFLLQIIAALIAAAVATLYAYIIDKKG